MENTPVTRSRFFFFVSLFSLCVVEMAVSSLLLEHFSGMGWSATFAEDSEGYLLVTRYFSGEHIPDAFQALLRYRLFSPLLPFVVSILSRVLPIPATFFLVNSFLWIGTTYLFYLFTQELLKSDDLALACSIIFTTSLPVMVWGLPIMVDMGAYFFAVLILYIDQKLKQLKGATVLGIITGLALLTKPTMASLLLFLIMYHLWIGYWKKALIIVVVSVAIVCSVYSSLGLEFEDFLSYSSPRHQGVFYVLNSLFFCFHFSVIFLLWSWKEFKEHRKFYVMFIVSVLSFYLPFVHNPRLLFTIYPALIPLIIMGVDAFSQRFSGRFHRDRECFFRLIVFLCVAISNILTGFYLYITRTIALRSIEDLIRGLKVFS